MQVNLQKLGNSRGVVIPKPLLAQVGLDETTGVEMTLEGDAIVLRRPAAPPRKGWAEAAAHLADAHLAAADGDGFLVMGEFGNAGDAELAW